MHDKPEEPSAPSPVMLTECGLLPAGMVGYRFNTVGVSDAISMGTDGMSFSLQSRDLIADSVETVMGAQVRAKFGQLLS